MSNRFEQKPPIQVPEPHEQGVFKIVKNSIWVHYKGNRYNLGSDDPGLAFIAYDDKNEAFFPSPQQIEEVIAHFMYRSGINEEQARKIKERYKIADARRKSPIVVFDPVTEEIEKVIIEDGYAEDTVRYCLNSLGDCWKVNMKEYKETLRKMKQNPPNENSGYQTPISHIEFLEILLSRLETMEPDEYAKLHAIILSILRY